VDTSACDGIRRVFLGFLTTVALLACNLISLPNTPAATPGPTPTTGPSPTFTPIPPPTPTPTPTPAARLESADQALFDGNYETARTQYRAALQDSQQAELRAEALWGLGRADYADRRYQDALSSLQQLVADYAGSKQAAQAYFLLGQTFTALERYSEAAEAWASYLKLRPGLVDAYVQELRGDALSQNGDYSKALRAYQAALSAPRLDDGLQVQVKIAKTYAAVGDYNNALAKYDEITNNTTNDYIKAQMDYLAGQAHQAIGQSEEAYQRYQHAVEYYPLAYDSYLGLVELVNAKVQVDEFERGLVDYSAGQYEVALQAFDRYLAANPQNDGSAHYYRALTLRALDRYQDALDEFNLFISNYSDNSHWEMAWDKKSDLLWQDLENYQAAAQTLLDFVAAVPSHPDAPTFLMDAGRVLERSGQLEQAAQVWSRIPDEYPASQQVAEAIFQAGIVHYRAENFEEALNDFQRSVVLSTQAEDQARAYLWLGKTQQKLGETTEVQTSWQRAQTIDPNGYYGERARDLLLDTASFTPSATFDSQFDLAKERAEAASWVRLTFDLPADTDLSGLGSLLQDPRLQRGTELWELGEYDQARLEFESLRQDVSQDPANSFRLANYMLDLGLYRPAINTVQQVLKLAGSDDQASSLKAPAYFNHVRYGLYYSDLILPAAQEDSFDPLFLFSVVWQESQFEGFVHSTAGARGLMQIIPSTGASLAKALGWPPFYDPEDLYRPQVSIRLGVYYLNENRQAFGGNLYEALAAYNAGPGSAVIWRDLSSDDPDLFLEVIRPGYETRQYIQNICEVFNAYHSLYSPTS
jgi:soluble lytic murein transglycosylase